VSAERIDNCLVVGALISVGLLTALLGLPRKAISWLTNT
jgi:hypothetical protein